MNYKLENNFLGSTFDKVAEKAKKISAEKNVDVEFEFNGINCITNKDTNLNLLYRDYHNAFLMGWKTVGPECIENYAPEVQKEFELRTWEAAEKEEIQRKEYEAKNKAERQAFEFKTKGIEVEIIDVDTYNDWKAKNLDGYGATIFEYAEAWAKLMQVEMLHGKRLVECAEATSFHLGFIGVTGFMYGAAVSILAKCWKYGEELRKWHNKEYNHEGEGVVNPAIITIEK